MMTVPGVEPDLLRYIDDNVIGKEKTFSGPFGRRKVVYCDYTASARSLKFIEDYIQHEVLPLYGNTHTSTSVTSMQTTWFREESRDIVRNAVNASEDDVVVFTGQGCTGAIHKLIHALNLENPPIVFVGPSEHHSNLLPWRELGAKIVRISETKEGMLDLNDLEEQLKENKREAEKRLMIGCFSAASNITGIVADDIATTLILHQYGALSFWDFATAAPYVSIDMNPLIPGLNQKAPYKDAIFFSFHKFVGGVQSPGILVAKKSLFKNPVPQGCGGGTVFFVTRNGHRYLKDTELREEGGTAAIVESIRAGMAMQLKQAVGISKIMESEEKIVKTVLQFLKRTPEILLLGSSSEAVKRLAVFSILVRHPRGSYLHHNFVCAVLNDIFGIQARGGCSCAGPYAHDLMGIKPELADVYEQVLIEDSRLDRHHLRRKKEHSNFEMLRPGFTRISLPYFMSESELTYVLEALKMVATEGWKLLPQYILNPETGEWRHNSNIAFRERKWLGSIRYNDGKMTINERRVSATGPCPTDYSDCLRTARSFFNKARKIAKRQPLSDHCVMFDDKMNKLRWFMLPSEAQDLLLGNCQKVKQDVPFTPSTFSGFKPSDSSTHYGRQKSFSIPHADDVCNRELRLLRQRSESQSPARNSSYGHLPQLPLRERCHSLGSSLLSEVLSLTQGSSRNRLVSLGSQNDVTDSDVSLSSDFDVRVGTPPGPLPDTPELRYVKGVTNEIATEIKSELRGVIAQVDDALLSDNTDVESNMSGSGLSEKKVSDSQRVALQRGKAFSVPNSFSSQTCCPEVPTRNVTLPAISFIQNDVLPGQPGSSPSTMTAERFSEYLAEFTSGVVSEMKSEFRDVVNVVDGMMITLDTKSPAPTPSPKNTENDTDNQQTSINSNEENVSPDQSLAKTNLNESNVAKDINLSSQDSGINLSDRDSSPSEPVNGKPISSVNRSTSDKCGLNSVVEIKDNKHLIPSETHWHCPPKSIWKPTCEAINEFKIIEDGDKVLVCLSGGKDSLSLLHTLHQYQIYASSKGIKFTIGAATVDPGSSAYNPKPLIPYLKALGVEFFYEEQKILDQASEVDCKSVCSFCSRMKRGRLYSTARKNNYNVIALGQHLDDITESFIMSVFHNGHLRSMKANYYVRECDLRVVRPFVYVREKHLRQFAESHKLPVIPENCPACFEAPKERHRVKQLLAQQEILFPKLFFSLKTAIKPLISYRYTGVESTTSKESTDTTASHYIHPCTDDDM